MKQNFSERNDLMSSRFSLWLHAYTYELGWRALSCLVFWPLARRMIHQLPGMLFVALAAVFLGLWELTGLFTLFAKGYSPHPGPESLRDADESPVLEMVWSCNAPDAASVCRDDPPARTGAAVSTAGKRYPGDRRPRSAVSAGFGAPGVAGACLAARTCSVSGEGMP